MEYLTKRELTALLGLRAFEIYFRRSRRQATSPDSVKPERIWRKGEAANSVGVLLPPGHRGLSPRV
jgi:hypothetical protein